MKVRFSKVWEGKKNIYGEKDAPPSFDDGAGGYVSSGLTGDQFFGTREPG